MRRPKLQLKSTLIMKIDLFEELHDGCRVAACGNPYGNEDDDYKCGVVRPDGSFLIQPEWTGACWQPKLNVYETHRYLIDEGVEKPPVYAIFDSDGRQRYSEYDSAAVLNSKCIAVCKGDKCGVISPDGAEILPIRYDFENDDLEGIALFESGKFTDNAKLSVLLEQVSVMPDDFRLQLSDSSAQNGSAELSEALSPEEAAELQRLAEPKEVSVTKGAANAKSSTDAAFCIENFRLQEHWLDDVKSGIESEGRAKEYAEFNHFTVMIGILGSGLRLNCMPAAKELSNWLLKVSPGAQVRFCHRMPGIPAYNDSIRLSLTVIGWKE